MPGGQRYRVTGGLADGWWASASATYCPSKSRTTLYLDVVSADCGMVRLLNAMVLASTATEGNDL